MENNKIVTIAGAVPAQMLYLTAMETSKLPIMRLGREFGLDETRTALAANLVAGFTASLASQIVVVPVDVVSQKYEFSVSSAIISHTDG